MNDIDYKDMAGVMYSMYCKAVGGKAFNGDSLPNWETFSSDKTKETQSNAWILTAKATYQYILATSLYH